MAHIRQSVPESAHYKDEREGMHMCMASFIPAGIQPDEKELWNGAMVNPDGHGWAIADLRERKLIIGKSMKPDQAISEFLAARDSNYSGPALFHSRIATSGRTDLSGVHPFRVGSDNRTVVAHNGILFSPKGSKSDTRIFAELILPRMGSLDKNRTMTRLNRFTGRGNKLVILTVNPARRANSYLVGEDQGFWSSLSGVWHSNYGYMGYSGYGYYSKSSKFSSQSGLWAPDGGLTCDEDDPADTWPWACEFCRTWNSVNSNTMICGECGTCQDCGMSQANCQCYTPTGNTTPVGALNGTGRLVTLENWRNS